LGHKSANDWKPEPELPSLTVNAQISQNMSEVDECTTHKCKHKSKMQIIISYAA
jgi:hypothetical protein